MFQSQVIFIRHSASGPMLEAKSTSDADGSSAADSGGYKLGEQRNDQHRGAAAADGSQPGAGLPRVEGPAARLRPERSGAADNV